MSVVAPETRPARGHSFDAMGVTVELLVDAESERAPDAMAAAEAEFHRLEQVFSRFRPDSELTLLNECGGGPVGRELLEVVDLAVRARERTGGRFDPTVHDALVSAGYDRSFDDVPRTSRGAPQTAARCGGHVEIDRARSTIGIEPGFRLDLGGIAKGFAVDRACAVLADAGGCLVNAGGDLAVDGQLRGGPWPVGVDVPGAPLTLAVTHGAIATSGRDHRRWRRGAVELHHLIEPSTGRPSRSDLVRVTVAADSAVEAEVLAKSLFLAGAEEARREADTLGVPCVLVADSGDVVLCGGLT